MNDHYKFCIPSWDITFEVERLRRDRHELIGELIVQCGIQGARLVNGYLNVGDFNFSSVRARQDRARLLRERAGTNGAPDWYGLLEDLSQRVFAAERCGEPAVDLREIPRPSLDLKSTVTVEGLTFPRQHPAILFGDGGTAKSYTALFVAGNLARQGLSVALFDWELCGEDHRERLERLFRADMPRILYCRCERPLSVEAERLRRVVRDNKVEYAIFDSVVFACEGKPEESEAAGRYFRAVREIGCGSLHVAHITKTTTEKEQKPFGSVFWHNGARATWFVEADERIYETDSLRLGFFNRKSNLGPLHPAVSLLIKFEADATIFQRVDLAESPQLAAKLSVRQRMIYLLRHGAMSPGDIAEEIDADLETIKREARRRRTDFVTLSDGRIGLHMKTMAAVANR